MREDLAVLVSDDVAAADVLAVVRQAGAPLLAACEVFDVYRDAEKLGTGMRVARRSRSPTTRPIGRSPTPTSRAGARRSSTRSRPGLEAGSVPDVAVFGAAGYTGALAARLLARHPHFELTAVTARSDTGRRLDELYPHHRVPLVLEELDLDVHADVDAAIVAYPHGAAAPLVAEPA